MGWKDIANTVTRAGAAYFTGGASELYFQAGGDSDIFGADTGNQDAGLQFAQQAAADRESQRKAQAQMMESQKKRFEAESAYLRTETDRYDKIYKPMEQGIASELAEGPALEEQAAIAGSTFSNEFDANIDAREREMMRSGVNHRPGSSAERMQDENDAYNKARGVATSMTQARREEDDAHFLRQTAFFNANGNGIQNRLMQGMQTMYGADYTANQNNAINMGNSAITQQNLSTQVNEQSGAGTEAMLKLAGDYLGKKNGEGNTPMQSLMGMFSGDKQKTTGVPTSVKTGAVQPAGTQASGVTTTAAPRTQAIPMQSDATSTKKQTGYANTYMNDHVTNQTVAAGRGALQSEVNNGFGRG